MGIPRQKSWDENSVLKPIDMKLTNDSYVIWMGTKNFTERYYRDKNGWLKVSARGRRFRMTAEQVLNHVLPAIAGVKPNVTIKVEHHELLAPKNDAPNVRRNG
jgi:hypothetical protein